MNDIRIEIVGDKEFLRYLESLGKSINPTMRQAMEEASVLVQDTAKLDYLQGPRPKHLQRVSSNLFTHVVHKVKGEGVNIEGRIGLMGADESVLDYGVAWEKGFYRNTKKGLKHYDARPYLGPALEDKKQKVFDIFSARIDKLTKDVNYASH